MEIRVLRYFLAIAREGSITNAAVFCISRSQPYPGKSRTWKKNWDKSFLPEAAAI